ncbi:MAG TPA: HlyD family efflux transporter periplasmic adaptor subunit [Candidatus Limiplasma sp.]|nr:HlyD family efflux transporter periplasmic adaptor subunit [Candidatus Limiplasma sp.]
MAMKRLMSLLTACLLLVPGLAAAEQFEGNVVATETELVTSPYGGSVKTVEVRQGQKIEVGDTIATMETTKYYAPEDGTIRGIFAETGDSLSTAEALLYIGPTNEYTISCTTNKAYASQETKYVRLGETVYIVSITDDTYSGEGIITSVDQESYTVETTSGDFYLERNVYIYRDADYDTESRLGRGTVYRKSETAVYGSGSLLKLYVENGEEVTRGQLLFETVSGDMSYTASDDGVITSTVSGVISSLNIAIGDTISEDSVLMTVIPTSSYEIEFLIGEDLLSSVYVGQPASIVFDWSEDLGEVVEGTVTRISYTSEESTDSSSEAQFKGYITFEADDTVKEGMSVTIETTD